MQPRAVEAHLHGKKNIVFQRLIRGRGINTVGIEPLVQHQALEHGLAVYQAFFSVKGNGAQGEIAVRRILNRAFLFQRQLQIVKVGLAGGPEVLFFHFQQKPGVRAVHPGAARALERALEGGLGAEFHAPGVPRNQRIHKKRAVFRIRDVLRRFDINGVHPFQPHRLPDARGAGVGAAIGRIAVGLLAEGLPAFPLAIVRADDQRVFPAVKGGGDFEGEGGVPPFMHAHALAVHPGFAAVIHRPQMQQHALALRFRGQIKGAPIPDGGHKILIVYAGKRAFRAEGNENFPLQLFLFNQAPGTAGSAQIHFKLPYAVQVHPGGAGKLRPGVFFSGNRGIDHTHLLSFRMQILYVL